MAVYVHSSRYERSVSGGIFEYFIDSPADIAGLPGVDRIRETSTAFCPATGQVWTLMSAGWVLI